MRGNGGLIGPLKSISTSAAAGMWDLNDSAVYQRQGKWPTMIPPPVTLTDTFTISSRNFYAPGDTFTFSKGTNVVTFPVRNGAIFKISMYGAGGGNFSGDGGSGGNPTGGILIVSINLSSYQNTNLYFYRGGGGQNSTSGIDGADYPIYSGGTNGGGGGAGTRGPGGGGRTDLRVTSNDPYTELLVAGGGGGGFNNLGTNGSRIFGSTGCSGMFGSYAGDNAGGGGGYYGGSASCSDDGSAGGAGSNYYDPAKTVTVFENTRISGQTGGNSGNGYFKVEVISTA